MKKSLILALALALVAGITVVGNVVAEQDKGPAEITLETDKAKKPATFPHEKHQASMECATCHEDSNFPADKKWTKENGHALCKDCHTKMNKEGKNAPTKCNGCHVEGKKKKLEGC